MVHRCICLHELNPGGFSSECGNQATRERGLANEAERVPEGKHRVTLTLLCCWLEAQWRHASVGEQQGEIGARITSRDECIEELPVTSDDLHLACTVDNMLVCNEAAAN